MITLPASLAGGEIDATPRFCFEKNEVSGISSFATNPRIFINFFYKKFAFFVKIRASGCNRVLAKNICGKMPEIA